jgi:tetratricopeptide (TPR) repeat protein
VPDGVKLAEYTERGEGDESRLLNRATDRLVAITMGEAERRLSAISDSAEAVKAYLAGLRAYRAGLYGAAFTSLTTALSIDSVFAAAALWRSITGFMAGSKVPVNAVEEASATAWRLRDQLSSRDRALLAAHLARTYPDRQLTYAEQFDAAQQAVRVNHDRPEAWLVLGIVLAVHGPYFGAEGWQHEGTAALDSALALDSAMIPALQLRLLLGSDEGDTTVLQKLWKRYLALNVHDDDMYTSTLRWLVPRMLGDSSGISAAQRVFGKSCDSQCVWLMLARCADIGLALDDPERAAVAFRHWALTNGKPAWSGLGAPLQIAAIRGRVSAAIAVHDSMVHFGGPAYPLDEPLVLLPIALAYVDPGYNRTADQLTARIDTYVDTSKAPEFLPTLLCFAELRRMARGDTLNTRHIITRIRRAVRSPEWKYYPMSVGRFEICPLLLEAGLEHARGRSRATPALDRLDSLMRRGPPLELPGNIANLLIAQWREEQGDYKSALAAVRRRVHNIGAMYQVVKPRYLREEGRLAALTGDTAGAVRAYTTYLVIRDRPDPGALSAEVNGVRAQLQLLSKAK